MPPAAFCSPTEPNIPEGPEHENYQHYINKRKEVYQLHAVQRQRLRPMKNLKKKKQILQNRDSLSKLDDRYCKHKKNYLVQYFIISKQVFLQ